MAFSWKADKVRAVKKLKQRKETCLKNGNSPEAKKIDRRIERLQKDG